jgi:hypothetical protein
MYGAHSKNSRIHVFLRGANQYPPARIALKITHFTFHSNGFDGNIPPAIYIAVIFFTL